MKTHIPGFPRIGRQRELKQILEAFWREEISEAEFLQQSARLRFEQWQLQRQSGIACLTIGDQVYYDQMLTTSLALGIVPARFRQAGTLSGLALEFAIARGQEGCCGGASDMTKWFNTNYHYIVPEIDATTRLQADARFWLEQWQQSEALGGDRKLQLIGPVTFLYLSRVEGMNKLAFLPSLVDAYGQLIKALQQSGTDWLQIDEPVLALELDEKWQRAFVDAYSRLAGVKACHWLLTTYFGRVDHHAELICSLPFDGLHVDLVAEGGQPQFWHKILPEHWVLSAGVVDGANVWRTDLRHWYASLQPLTSERELWLSSSCSLLHCPLDLTLEADLPEGLRPRLAFGVQKCQELALLRQALEQQTPELLPVLPTADEQLPQVRLLHNCAAIGRPHSLAQRRQAQKSLALPLLPTTTIGSFPQTNAIRQARASWRRGELADGDYRQCMEAQIRDCIRRQEVIGLDVLVHGEPERNDMVEYFGELLEGVAVTRHGWVQSYGSRCVKPPIIYGNINRRQAMTVDWITYAQQQTDKPVKGMLTGPVTMLCWSFVRQDCPPEAVAEQMALAISEEVTDLVAAGIRIIQIDEPALREGLPLKRSHWQRYLDWATAAYRLTHAHVDAAVQIHSHMCYAEFQDICQAIKALDVDVLSMEAARSQALFLAELAATGYAGALGPGVYDIHSPQIPSVDDMRQVMDVALRHFPASQLWLNPDCGLKTRNWQEVTPALENLVALASQLRRQYSQADRSPDCHISA